MGLGELEGPWGKNLLSKDWELASGEAMMKQVISWLSGSICIYFNV